jgi:hypothetical protein
MEGENCSSGCATRNHLTWGECVKSKGAVYGNMNAGRTKAWNRELDLYASAVRQGIQPDGTTTQAVRQALDISDKAGAGYGVDFAQATPMGD